jgi:hypothetical protein
VDDIVATDWQNKVVVEFFLDMELSLALDPTGSGDRLALSQWVVVNPQG